MGWARALGIAAVYGLLASSADAEPNRGGNSPPSDSNTPAAESRPIVTRQQVFTIPFTVVPTEQSHAIPAEVRLFVSADRGATWNFYQRQEPGVGRFHFRAGHDGEFWFAVRTLNRSGQISAEPTRPELMVIVDTEMPQLQLDAEVGQSGEIRTRWSASDQRLAHDTFRLEYRTGPGEPWRAVAIEPTDPDRPDEYRGTVSWWPEPRPNELEIRTELRDQAGNVAVVKRTLTIPPIAATDQLASSANTSQTTRLPADTSPEPTGIADSSPENPREDTDTAPSFSGWIPARVDSRDSNSAQRLPSLEPSTGTVPPADTAAQLARVGLDNMPGESQAAAANPILARYSPSPKFRLEYDINQELRPQQIARMELWWTEDGGQTWKRYGQDDDTQSPILIQVEREGNYGFRLVPHTHDGRHGRIPQAGDLPDMAVVVDSTRPTVRLISATPEATASHGKLSIQWQAEDANLAANPVTLRYGTRPDGPWETIADQIPNTGRFTWESPTLADNIYVRVEIRDLAGNVGEGQLAHPIDASPLSPTAHIRAVQPIASP